LSPFRFSTAYRPQSSASSCRSQSSISLAKHGHFNLAQGAIGCAMGIGAAISTTLTGYITDNFGSYAAFNILTALAAVGFAAIALAMPETKPPPETAELQSA